MRRVWTVWSSGLLIAAGLASLPGCRPASADATTPPGGAAVAVVASISSATLAEDCAPPPTTQRAHATADSARGGYSGRRACRQTNVQLALATAAEGQPSTF